MSTDAHAVTMLEASLRQFNAEETSYAGELYVAESDGFAQSAANVLLARTYEDAPRIIAVSSTSHTDSTTGDLDQKLGFDILSERARSVVMPIQRNRSAYR